MIQKERLKQVTDKQEEKMIEDKATKHAEWYADHFRNIVFTVYKDAFTHGYKHGKNDNIHGGKDDKR